MISNLTTKLRNKKSSRLRILPFLHSSSINKDKSFLSKQKYVWNDNCYIGYFRRHPVFLVIDYLVKE